MRNYLDETLQPKAEEYLRSKGHTVIADNQITHDVLVDGLKEEWKFLNNVYFEVYLETFNCADPNNCEICRYRDNPKILLGWAHRDGYCKADTIRIFHCRDKEIKQIVTFNKKIFLEWYWDNYLRKKKVHKMISSWEGQHRTLGEAIPFSEIPPNLIQIEVLE